ncbi:MAG: sodium-dependent bicarbonate transport family permease, partial [Bacteroidota bacterium]
MDFQILISNITNPTLLFFVLGIIAANVKSDLEIPPSSSKFISLYLLFAIGFKGGQELASTPFNSEIFYSIVFGIAVAALIPFYTFFILKQRMSVSNAGAVAATYGSVSVVTFVAAATFLEGQGLDFGGHMVAIMALMESPAIIIGVI